MKISWLYSLIISCLLVSSANATTEKYRMMYHDDPSTSVVVSWSGHNGIVYYGTSDEGTNYSAYQMNQGVDRTTSHAGLSNHFVRITGLQPGTVYYFVVWDYNNDVSQRFSFRTISNNPNDPVSFIAGGDSREGQWPVESCNCRASRQDANRLVSKIRPDFIAFNGDFVLLTPILSDYDQEWQDWLDDWQLTIASDGRMFPMVPTLGNHEADEDLDKLFDTPNSTPYYAMNFSGNLFRFYSLNTEEDACSDIIQKAWFQNDLQQYNSQSNSTYWKIAQYHIPMIPQAEYDPRTDIIQCWAPFYEQYGVRLILESHTHVINTSWPLVASTAPGNHEGFIREDSMGTVYTSSNWGAPRRTPYSQFSTTRGVTDQFDGFFFIQVNKDSIHVQTAIINNVANVTELLDDVQGSDLPGDVMVWNAADSPGDFWITNPNPLAVGTSKIAENKSQRATLAPNPTSDFVTIQFKDFPKAGTRIEIYDGRGQRCRLIENVTDQNMQIDVSELCQGVNFFNIITKDDIESHKLIIAK